MFEKVWKKPKIQSECPRPIRVQATPPRNVPAIVRATPAVPRTKPRSNWPYPMSMRKGRSSDCESASASL